MNADTIARGLNADHVPTRRPSQWSPTDVRRILSGREVLGYFQRKANDYERWLAGMRRVRDGLRSGGFLRVRPP